MPTVAMGVRTVMGFLSKTASSLPFCSSTVRMMPGAAASVSMSVFSRSSSASPPTTTTALLPGPVEILSPASTAMPTAASLPFTVTLPCSRRMPDTEGAPPPKPVAHETRPPSVDAPSAPVAANLRKYRRRSLQSRICLPPLKDDVPDAMAQPEPAPLELGFGARGRAFREARRRVAQRRSPGEHGEHVMRVVLPIRRHVQHAPRGQAARGERREIGLDEAALVMPQLRPRIGEEHVDGRERTGRDHVAHHLDRVVLHDADVGETQLPDVPEQAADAGCMHLDREVVAPRRLGRDARSGFSHARPDLHDDRRLPPEQRAEIQRLRRERDAEARHELGMRALLRRRKTALAQDVAADRSGYQGDGKCGGESANYRGCGRFDRRPGASYSDRP